MEKTVGRYYELLVKSSLFIVEERGARYYTVHSSELMIGDRVLTLEEMMKRPEAVVELLLTGVNNYWDSE